MIDIFAAPPPQTGSSGNEDVEAYFKVSTDLGGESLSEFQADGEMYHTPVEDWMS